MTDKEMRRRDPSSWICVGVLFLRARGSFLEHKPDWVLLRGVGKNHTYLHLYSWKINNPQRGKMCTIKLLLSHQCPDVHLRFYSNITCVGLTTFSQLYFLGTCPFTYLYTVKKNINLKMMLIGQTQRDRARYQNECKIKAVRRCQMSAKEIC